MHSACIRSRTGAAFSQSEMRNPCNVSPDMTAANPAMQVVPSVPNLYKNSFTYHSASCVPADFQECGNFLGAQPRPLPMLRPIASLVMPGLDPHGFVR